MHDRNQDIRTMIENNHLYYWQVAEKLGITEGTFSVWLRHKLSEDRRKRVMQAIDNLVNNH